MRTVLGRIEADGLRYELEIPALDLHMQQALATGVPYEHLLLRWSSRLVRGDAKRILDIGANIGNHTVYWGLRLRVKIEAFEPTAGTAAVLRRNIARNGLDEVATVHEYALGASDGKALLLEMSDTNTGMNRVLPNPDGLLLIRQADSLGFQDVTLMKIDVEGMELPVIRGALRTIERCRPLILVETSDISAVASLLAPLGYHHFPLTMAGMPTFLFSCSGRALLRASLAPEPYLRLWEKMLRTVKHGRSIK